MEKNNINKTDVIELRNLALSKKDKLKYRTISSSIDGDYKVKIGGIGNKSIKLEIFLNYEWILEHKDNSILEKTIYNKLMELPKARMNTRLGRN